MSYGCALTASGSGSNWGYEFDGEGNMKKLKAVLMWVEDDEQE